MKKIFLAFVVTALFNTTQAQQVKNTYYDYAETQIMESYQVNSSGEKDGWYKGYDKNGVVKVEATYKNGDLDGIRKQYATHTGKRELAQTETYKDNLLHGPAKYYGDGGIVLKEGEYVEGEKHGKWLDVYPYTNYDLAPEDMKGCEYIKRYIQYDHGKVVDLTIESGELKEEFYPSGKTRAIIPYSNSKKQGVAKWYFPNGDVEMEESYENGELIYTKTLYPDGKIREYRGFKNGEEVFEQYDKNGSPTRNMENWKINKEKRQKEGIKRIKERRADSTLLSGSYQDAMNLYISIDINPYPLSTFYEEREKFLNWEINGETYQKLPDDIHQRYMDASITTNEYSWKRDIFFSYMDSIVKQDMILYDELQVLQKDIFVAKKKYDELYGPEVYTRPSILGEKSRPILDDMMKKYKAEKDFTLKKQLGEELLKAYNTMNAYSPEKCKELKKSLKKVDDQNQIRLILAI